MQKCHLIMVTSVKEGWGLIVTEAASQGTPAVVYDVDGLRDSVRHQETGLIIRQNTPAAAAEAARQLFQDGPVYDRMKQKGQEWSKDITFTQSYKDFLGVLSK